MTHRTRIAACFLSSLLVTASAIRAAAPYFAIHVVDADTGRGVPLVYLRTTYEGEYVTDSAGYVAFNEPGLMNGETDVWFEVHSYGYESPKGAFGVEGMALKPKAGGAAEVKLKRTQIAERLYRLTGYGIYRDSVLLGVRPPLREPLLDAKVTGQDTVQTAIYKGKYLWLWQDTDRLGYGLGCFAMTGATAPAPDTIDLDRGIDFTYFTERPNEFARAMSDVPLEGSHPIWVDGLTVTRDAGGNERLIGRYAAVNHDMSPFEMGLVIYDDARNLFVRQLKFDRLEALGPSGRPFRVIDGGKRYVYFPEYVRVEDSFEAVTDPSRYEVFTCLKADGGDEVDRDSAGKVHWRWERGWHRLNEKTLARLVEQGKIKREELPEQLVDADTGHPIKRAAGSIAWNPYLRRWTMLFGQGGGDSFLGEIWFATANAPEGPWTAAKKVATHAMPKNNNDFYNPIQHDELFREGGRIVYFEGTFVNTFSGNPHPTPYYNYNNILYRIDLADPRLQLPAPPPGLSQARPADAPAQPAGGAATRRTNPRP